MNNEKIRIGVLTSGGDAPGMNAAVRAVVRTAIGLKAEVFAIYEGYRGLVNGGDNIKKFCWSDVSNILHKGGTAIGTARCPEFKNEDDDQPKIDAAKNLLDHGIDRLVIIGGDGSLTGASVFFEKWPELLEKIVAEDESYKEKAKKHPRLSIVGLIGSIDNDMYGSDLTIGVDTALHRILGAVDAISSTAASHQRTFVVEVMGNRCGYLALMSALITGADWVIIPEQPPEDPSDELTWEDRMCNEIQKGRNAGRRAAIVIMAEGAIDANGKKLSPQYIQEVLEDKLGEEARITVLGHVQRGGAPSAFDRNMSTIQGYKAAVRLIQNPPDEPVVAGLQGNEVIFTSLDTALKNTQAVAEAIKNKRFDKALEERGAFVNDIFPVSRTLIQSGPRNSLPEKQKRRFAILHSGTQTPGMNTAARAAVRLALNEGHRVFGVRLGFKGLISDNMFEMNWMDVNGWAHLNGAELGINRFVPDSREDFDRIANHLKLHKIDGLLIIGGWTAYESAYKMYQQQNDYPAFNIPIVCIPATISNRLPGTEVSIGPDTALNNIVDAVDKIKQSAVGVNRCFITEVAGRNCGYLTLMSSMATGAERFYLPEDKLRLERIWKDLNDIIGQFRHGRQQALIIRNESTHKAYDTQFLTKLFEEESGDLFGARNSILGHIQHGGSPSPIDRVLATRFADAGIKFLIKQTRSQFPFSAFLGIESGEIIENNLNTFPAMVDGKFQRPLHRWWEPLRDIAANMSQAQDI